MAKEKLLWENYILIGEVMKSERLKFVVSAATKDGYRCITIREFYLKKATAEWKPGRDGIVLPLNMPLNITDVKAGAELKLSDSASGVMELLGEAIERASTMELVDPDNQVWIPVKEPM